MRFLVAAQAALEHPAIVRLTGCGRAGNFVFLTLDYVVGTPLQAKLAADAATGDLSSADEALRIVRAIAGALQHAHDHGLVHGDVKPGNVLPPASGWRASCRPDRAARPLRRRR